MTQSSDAPNRGIPSHGMCWTPPYTQRIQQDKARPRWPHCNETDHPLEDCTLAPLLPMTKTEWWLPAAPRLGKCLFPGPSTAPASRRICLSWNVGACIFPGVCSFRHICALCSSHDHRHNANGEINVYRLHKLTSHTSTLYTHALESQPTSLNYTRQPSGGSNRLW